VFVTGTFDDWGKTVRLDRVGDGFVKQVSLPIEKVQYKVRFPSLSPDPPDPFPFCTALDKCCGEAYHASGSKLGNPGFSYDASSADVTRAVSSQKL